MITRIILALYAIMFTGFGLWSLIAPFSMTAGLGVEVSGPNAAFEMRGIYGGVSLGAALLTAAGALRPAMTGAALWFLMAYMGGYTISRLYSLVAGDSPTATSWAFASFEIASFVLVTVLLLRRRP